MEFLRYDKTDNVLNQKIEIEMTIGDFLSMYIAKMTCLPNDFEDYIQEIFPLFKNSCLFTESVSTEEMEDMIDKMNIPHEEWL